ncbi:MAG: GNAT family N-acetyltransferase [Ruminococcaceae bacterium]|nr:GNAT family N-acetyltransferase [Oscillospiraceae bacterium]
MKKETVFKIFSNMPTLHTERLSLRPMHPIDAEDMFDYARRPEVTKYLLWREHEDIYFSRDYLNYINRRYALGDFYDWAIIDHESRRMIGTCGFTKIDTANNSAEIGYVLNPDFHRRGFGSEAVRRILKFGFEELNLNRIEARFMQGNEASLALMRSVGMTFEGYMRDLLFVKGSYRTVGVSSILRSEYEKIYNTEEGWE